MRYEHIIKTVYQTPWAITPEVFARLERVVRLRVLDGISREDIALITGFEKKLERPMAAHNSSRSSGSGSIAVLPITGIITQRGGMDDASMPLFSTAAFGRYLRTLIADPKIDTILLDIDSPGGSVSGVPELAKIIFDARSEKRVVAIANSFAASAAYWLGCAASEFYCTPSGEVGSIGVFSAHEDYSKHLEKLGIKVTLISAGEFKVEGNPYEPLSDAAHASIQADVDSYYAMFLDAVAKHRGVTASHVKKNFGKGRTLMAEAALSVGMIDDVLSFDEVIEKLGGKASSRSTSASSTADNERDRTLSEDARSILMARSLRLLELE
jgi:signal peptide peptidase SppA